MAEKYYTLTPTEEKILEEGISNPNVIAGYFFRPAGADQGFQFDYGFTDEGKWQEDVYLAIQKLIVVIGGVGTGKTLGVGMAAACWAITTTDFRFLNVAQKAWQARLMYDLILRYARNTPFEKMIYAMPSRPYPKIVIRFIYRGRLVESILEFMSVDKNATGLFSWRGDWINIEEAGLLDNLNEIVANIVTRLTGSSPMGRPYVGRLSLISNPWDVPHLWYLFDMAKSDPSSLSMVLSTRHNLNVTQEQIDQLLKLIPEDEHERFLDGARPEGKGSYFAKETIYKCENRLLGELAEKKFELGEEGYEIVSVDGAGVVRFAFPVLPGRLYMLLGDPGIDNAPHRNSPVLMVWDVTEFPKKPAILVNFWWGFGHNQITPFVEKMRELKERYDPIYTAIDSTGPQRNMAEVVNSAYYTDEDGETNGIAGLDFSGAKKMAYLVTLRILLEKGRMSWPKNISGKRSQLANYDPIHDKKLAQDIVATMSMFAFVARSWFHVDPSSLKDNEEDGETRNPIRRLARKARNARQVRRDRIHPADVFQGEKYEIFEE